MGEREDLALLRALDETGRALESARAGFDETADRDLLAYYLYEIHALESRYACLLRKARDCHMQQQTGRGRERQ